MKLFVNIKSSARERHWDTFKEASKIFNVFKDESQIQQSSIKIYSKNSNSIISKIKGKIVENLDLINYQVLPNIQEKVDLIYLWGSLPKNAKKPYIIEFDNPYVLTYYNKKAFLNKKEILKKELEKAKKITFLSRTAKNHFIELMGKEFENRCFVNYPFMKRNYINNKRDNKIINFLFIGLDFNRKGGLELLEAFSKVATNNMRLTFISNISEDIKNKYKNDKIVFLKPVKREKLLNEIYPKMDVFAMPTLHESFGVVFLEALSFGMGIIGTNVYATPEMIKNNYNGKLLHHPFIKPTTYNGVSVIDCTQKRIGEFNKSYRESGEFYYSLYDELKKAIIESEINYKKWQENSIKLYEEKFSEEKWKENFERIIK
jgi:glycosyltransferase involved in cell wall biosynthesis